MKFIIYILIFTLYGCFKPPEFAKVKILQVNILDFPPNNNGTAWDSLDGPDIFLEIYLNRQKLFTSNKSDHMNVLRPPVLFIIDTSVIAQPGEDYLTYILYDTDSISNEIIDSFTFDPAASKTYPFSKILQQSITQWETVYGRP